MRSRVKRGQMAMRTPLVIGRARSQLVLVREPLTFPKDSKMSNDPKVAQQAPAPNAANQTEKSGADQTDKTGADQAGKTDAKPATPPADAKKI